LYELEYSGTVLRFCSFRAENSIIGVMIIFYRMLYSMLNQ